MTRILFLAGVAFTALSLGAGLAHVYAFPNKIGLSADAYLAAQQIYRGWAWLGIAIFAAIGSTAALAWRVRAQRSVRGLVAGATACIALALVVFFILTFPGNEATQNWTQLPANWETLRRNWEYGHITGAVLYFVALLLLTLAALEYERAP